MKTLAEAKDFVRTLLAMAEGDGDAVRRMIDRSERNARQFATARGETYTSDDANEYALQRQALAELTGMEMA
ncbi:hypothetical protein AB0I37_25010 [Micromonospora purpureochromogenes]|uniref:hypothetical protein n=1 Tax=Micromonospora purpureochromogenes TaxID=47872 RepID=UPI0033C05E9A